MVDDGGYDDLPPAYPSGGGGFTSKLNYHFEGLIPLIIILIIAGIAGAWLGFWDVPFIDGGTPMKMLIVGEPTMDTKAALDMSKDLVEYRIRDADSLRTNAVDKLAQYDIIMLDQSNQESKMLPSTVGEALHGFVTKGGKLIVVKNSGIYNPEALELVGWMANFGSEIVPVECTPTKDNYPSCIYPINMTAELERADFGHPIMLGIEKVPATGFDEYLYVEIFPVSSKGNEIATIRDVQSTKYYPGIVEKTLLFGKSIYFNYDPGKTPGIFRNTLKYLN